MPAKLPPNCYWRGKTIWGKKRLAGTTYRFSLETDNPSVAGTRVRNEIAELIARVSFGDDRKTWAQAYASWGEWVERERPFALATYDRYLTSIDQIAPFLDGLYQDEIDKAKIEEIVRERRKAEVSIATIRRDLTALSSVLDHCIDIDWREDNPALVKMKRMKETRDPIMLPEAGHIELVISRCPGLFAKLVESARDTGCRQSELRTAARPNLDHDRKQLTVIGKGNKRRTIDLGERAYATLRDLPAHMRSKSLFWHSDGEPYRNPASQFSEIVRTTAAWAQKEGTEFRPFRFHDLRHYYAVHYLKNGGNIYLLQGHLGHASIKTTELYLEFLTPEEKLRAKYGAQISAQPKRFEAENS